MDKTRFIELLQKEKALKLENRRLNAMNRSEYSELTSYKILLFQQAFYENLFKYIDLVKSCLAGKINCYAFQWNFFEMYQYDIEISDKWIEKISRSRTDLQIKFDTDLIIEKIKNKIILVRKRILQ